MAYSLFNAPPISAPSAPACPPIKFICDGNCPFIILHCGQGQKDLCDRIIGASRLADKAAAALQAGRVSGTTASKFRQVFGDSPTDRWELPWAPRRSSASGDMVAARLRTVASELRTRDTLYRCTNIFCGPQSRPEPAHPTDTVVTDTVAWAALCKNEVGLCPGFWQLRPEWQEGTILHEALHLCFGVTCAWFQHDAKEKPRNSASCYEIFALINDNKAPEPASVSACKLLHKGKTP